MNRALKILMTLALSLSLCACGKSGTPTQAPVADPEVPPTHSPAPGTSESTPEIIPETTPQIIPDTSVSAVPNITEPEQLQGVWLQTGFEIEGYVDDALPYIFNSLIFRTDEDGSTLLASAQSGDYSGFIDRDSYSDLEVTLLDHPLYEGCGNDVWSVRIGDEAPLNENGYPAETELYVTLTDQNTLLQQRYFSFDGGPGVSYQTYKRFLPEAPHDMDESVLAGGIFELSGYIDADGIRHDEHPLYSDFRLTLYPEGEYTFTSSRNDQPGDAHIGGGYDWSLAAGGTVWLRSEDAQNGFGGALSRCDGTENVPELLLWDNMDGILCLKHVGYDGYVDTMDDLEGIAFAAPANALLVYYGDGYLDMDWYRNNTSIPVYDLADGPDARQILISCVNDNTTLWLVNDGFEVARFGTLMAGESIIIQAGYSDSGSSELFMELDGEEYYIALSPAYLSLDMWDYIVI